MITTHRLPEEAFAALASGGGDAEVIRHLRAAQLSKQMMLLHVLAESASGDRTDPAAVAFTMARRLLATVQAADPSAFAWALGLPHLGAWVHDCLAHLERGMPPDLGYLAAAAVAAAVRAGVQFELDVPVRDGRVLLPGLGSFRVTDRQPWVRMRGDGESVTVGAHAQVPYAALRPDDGSGAQVRHWQGTLAVRAVAEGQTWDVLLETADQYLDRFTLAMPAAMTPDEAASWRQHVQSAWQVLVRQHGWAAGPIAAGVSVIVPLIPRGDGDLDSATTPAAFGAIATSPPPSPVIMAETLVHEFQHLKLCGLMDMLPLIEHCDDQVYAPWRQDPRPVGGLLQGVYAYLGVVRFWNVQRHVETEPEKIFSAQVTYGRWRRAIEPATGILLGADCLTGIGVRFVELLRDQGRSLESEPVPADASAIAAEVALDHKLTWQLRHSAIDAGVTADLAAAYRRGEPLGDQKLPRVRIEEETRKVDSTTRSRMLSMRYLDPGRYRALCRNGLPGFSRADALLVTGQTTPAAQAYRDEIAGTTEPRPEAWTGLALAMHRLAPTPLRQAFATRLPIMFDVHACLCRQGILGDPLDLAAWFA